MKDYKDIRQRYLNGESQRSIAKSLGISRNTVSKYCEGASLPGLQKPRIRPAKVVTDEVECFIKSCLLEDSKEGLKKQQHTAKRIFERLVTERGFTGGESTIRRIVKKFRENMPKAFIPLEFSPAEVIQVDWGEAAVYLNDEKTVVNLFCARLCYSCRPFVFAYHKQNEESFLDAFVKLFNRIGGVPKRIIFDNARVAVKDGFGKHARMQQGYSVLSSHYGFNAVFCNPAQGHEKGLVEGLVGFTRRNTLVPIPRIRDLAELNALLEQRCSAYEKQTVKGRPDTVGRMYDEERNYFRPLPVFELETAKSINVRVNAFSTVSFKSNQYSVPVKYVGQEVSVKGYPETVEIYLHGICIESHERLMGKCQKSYKLEHYMPLLMQRPRALFDAAPIKHNIPAEILEQYRKENSYGVNVVSLLDYCAKRNIPVPIIENPVKVLDVDLSVNDKLSVNGGEN